MPAPRQCRQFNATCQSLSAATRQPTGRMSDIDNDNYTCRHAPPPLFFLFLPPLQTHSGEKFNLQRADRPSRPNMSKCAIGFRLGWYILCFFFGG